MNKKTLVRTIVILDCKHTAMFDIAPKRNSLITCVRCRRGSVVRVVAKVHPFGL